MANRTAHAKASSSANWTSTQAYLMAVICLLIGVGAGWFLRGSQSPATAPVATSEAGGTAGNVPAGNMGGFGGVAGMGQQAPSPAQLKRMADTQAAPLLAQLKSTPNDANLMIQIGNSYFDSGEACRETNQDCPEQFKTAIEYYERALKIQPTNTNVRTDMGIAWWEGLHDADTAITAFDKALSYEPTKPQTLQSLGIVRWKGKADPKGAIAAWEKLLQSNPTYEKRDKIQQLIAEAKRGSF